MGAGQMKALSGFSLGVFAAQRGKKADCKPDDDYSKSAVGDTLQVRNGSFACIPISSTKPNREPLSFQACFLEYLKDKQCDNVFLEVGHSASTE
jgi:hypothetical protein